MNVCLLSRSLGTYESAQSLEALNRCRILWSTTVDVPASRQRRTLLKLKRTGLQSSCLSLDFLGSRSNKTSYVSNFWGFYQDNSFAEPISASFKL